MAEMKVSEMPNWLAWLIAIPALAIAALFGFVVFVVILGLVATIALYLGVRVWWLRRQMRKVPTRDVIEAEYVVVRERESRVRRD